MTDTSTASIAELVPGRYRLDPGRSWVRYSGKHLFGLGTVQATLAVKEGKVQVEELVETSTAYVTVDAASFTSGNARRDRDVASAGLLDVATYPDVTFESTRLLPDTGGGWLLKGTVTAHGRTVAVDVRVDRVTEESGGLRVHARAERLDRTAFGITGSKGMVGRHLDLELDVFAVPS